MIGVEGGKWRKEEGGRMRGGSPWGQSQAFLSTLIPVVFARDFFMGYLINRIALI